MIKEDLIQLITELKEMGLSYEHIGAAIGYTSFSVRCWHLGQRIPRMTVVMALQTLLKKSRKVLK